MSLIAAIVDQFFVIFCNAYFVLQVLSDDAKRKQYDAWGTTSEQMGMGSGGMGGAEGQRFSQGWQFRSSIDPEELFRKIFGDAGFKTGGFGTEFEDFAESSFGFGAAQEVRNI